MKRDVLKIFIKYYEETVNEESVVFHGKKYSYRQIFREQAASLRKAIMESSEYEPFRVEP